MKKTLIKMSLFTDLNEFLSEKFIRPIIEKTIEMKDEPIDDIYNTLTGLSFDLRNKTTRSTTKATKVEDTKCTLEEYEEKYEGKDIKICTHVISCKDKSGLKICCKEVKNGTTSSTDPTSYRCSIHKNSKSMSIQDLKNSKNHIKNATTRSKNVGLSRRTKSPPKPSVVSSKDDKKSTPKMSIQKSLRDKINEKNDESQKKQDVDSDNESEKKSIVRSVKSVKRQDVDSDDESQKKQGVDSDDESEKKQDVDSDNESEKRSVVRSISKSVECTPESVKSNVEQPEPSSSGSTPRSIKRQSTNRSSSNVTSDSFTNKLHKENDKKVEITNIRGKSSADYDFYLFENMKDLLVVTHKTKEIKGVYTHNDEIDVDKRIKLPDNWLDNLNSLTRSQRRSIEDESFDSDE